MRKPWLVRLTPARLALIYVLLSAFWVVVSSELLLIELKTSVAITRFEVIKGLAFIGASGAVIYWISRTLLEQLRRSENSLQNSEQHRRFLEHRLLQSQKMEALGRLAGGIAHDFNNTLTVILSACHLLKKDKNDGADASQHIESIARAASSATGLTRQLLAFSRRQVLEIRSINLNDVVSEVSKMVVTLLPANVTLELRLDPDLWTVVADPSQITQILMNLCLNARDAMPSGGSIGITTSNQIVGAEIVLRLPEITPGPNVVLTVKDNGNGISPALLDQIFEPFFTTKPEDRGTGLGLSTVYGIVKLSGGCIDVTSQVGKGSAFAIYFPKAETVSSTQNQNS
jgi:two-component system cell cycle sensor histidine kinase/response regulator CckA